MTKQEKTNYDKMTRAEKIEYYANISNTICVSNGNGKTGGGIYTLSFPAVVTCRNNAPCVRGCYALRGKQTIPNVAGAYWRNLRIYNENRAEFWRQVRAYIALYDIHVLRLFDCGDIPDADFLTGIVELAHAYPGLIIYGYTKKYELVNNYLDQNGGKLPGNFILWFSAWDRSWVINNPFNMPVAYVDFTNKDDNPVIPSAAFRCPGRAATCTLCRACFNGRHNAVVFGQH